MGRNKLSDEATADDADWSFLEIPGMMKALEYKAKAFGSQYNYDSDDLFQEAVLALAVRPSAVAGDLRYGGVEKVVYRAGLFMITRAETGRNQAKHEAYPADDEWYDPNAAA